MAGRRRRRHRDRLGPPIDARPTPTTGSTGRRSKGDVVRVHWVEGNQAFGERALKIGDDAVAGGGDAARRDRDRRRSTSSSTPTSSAFYDALGPATRENVGGEAHPDIRTLFALITPDEIDASWVESVVPHELTHVVFQTAVDNPYHDPPHWLNEGLAVYLSDGYADLAIASRSRPRRATARSSRSTGSPARSRRRRDRFFLAYAESVSAVDRIVRVNGRDALVKLIRSYHDGVSDDEAFQAALGRGRGRVPGATGSPSSARSAPAQLRPAAGAGRAAPVGLDRAAAEPVVRRRSGRSRRSRRARRVRARSTTTRSPACSCR